MPYLSASPSRESTPVFCQRQAARIGPKHLGTSLMQIRTPGRKEPQSRWMLPLAADMRPPQALCWDPRRAGTS
jgi:hypothetical protein